MILTILISIIVGSIVIGIAAVWIVETIEYFKDSDFDNGAYSAIISLLLLAAGISILLYPFVGVPIL